MYNRKLYRLIKEKINHQKIIVIYGADNVGKTTLLRKLYSAYAKDSFFLDENFSGLAQSKSGVTFYELKQIIDKYKMIFIDNPKHIKNIGLTLKMLQQSYPDKQIIISGSPSFDLANEIKETLLGRMCIFNLHPLTLSELIESNNLLYVKGQLNQRLIYGMYPEVIDKPANAENLLKQLSGDLLYKSLSELHQIRKPEIVTDLLRELAFSVGKQISYGELASNLNLAKETIAIYLKLLEKSFVIFRLNSFSRELNNELSKKQKIYFWDNGIRNAIINNFNPVGMRMDAEALWENFVIAERLKRNHYTSYFCNSYYWRTYQRQEINYIEESDGHLSAVNIKWKTKRKTKFPKSFFETYPVTEAVTITPDNYWELAH